VAPSWRQLGTAGKSWRPAQAKQESPHQPLIHWSPRWYNTP